MNLFGKIEVVVEARKFEQSQSFVSQKLNFMKNLYLEELELHVHVHVYHNYGVLYTCSLHDTE